MSQGFDPLARSSGKEQRTGQKPQPAIDAETVQQQCESQFSELEDPRGAQGVEHPFLSIVEPNQ